MTSTRALAAAILGGTGLLLLFLGGGFVSVLLGGFGAYMALLALKGGEGKGLCLLALFLNAAAVLLGLLLGAAGALLAWLF